MFTLHKDSFMCPSVTDTFQPFSPDGYVIRSTNVPIVLGIVVHYFCLPCLCSSGQCGVISFTYSFLHSFTGVSVIFFLFYSFMISFENRAGSLPQARGDMLGEGDIVGGSNGPPNVRPHDK